MAVIGRYRVPISDTKVDILAIPVILKVSNNGGTDMTALLRRIRMRILGKELLQEITEDAWNDGHTHGQERLIRIFNSEVEQSPRVSELLAENKKLKERYIHLEMALAEYADRYSMERKNNVR